MAPWRPGEDRVPSRSRSSPFPADPRLFLSSNETGGSRRPPGHRPGKELARPAPGDGQARDIAAQRTRREPRPCVGHGQGESVGNLRRAPARAGAVGTLAVSRSAWVPQDELVSVQPHDRPTPARLRRGTLGGDKSGSWEGWNREVIPRAEGLYEEYLKEREQEEGER